jgi:hypothetical protein
MTGAALLVTPGATAQVDAFPKNEHAKATLDLALNLTVCDRPGVQSSRFLPAKYLTEHPSDMHLSPRELIERSGLTVEEYCQTLTEPVTNNENSLLLMQAATWLVAPRASVATIGRITAAIRIVFVVVFAAACLSVGLSVALVWLAAWAAVAILGQVAWLEYNEYPFLVVLPLVWAALCVLVYSPLRYGTMLRRAGLALALGVIGGFAMNLRSSFTPILLLHWAIVVLIAAKALAAERGVRYAAQAAATAVVTFAAGVMLFQATLIRPVVTPHGATTTNYTYHAVAHSLVLGLAVPENPLSRAEGIRWDDMVGRALALRERPGVAYLGPEYERVLFEYYTGLWRRAPRQMLSTYWLKIRRVGDGVFLAAARLVNDVAVVGRMYRVWIYRSNGAGLIACCAAATALAAAALWRKSTHVALLATLLTSAALLVMVESAIIYSEFAHMYHAYMLFGVAIAPAVLLQILVDTVAAIRLRSAPAARPQAA